MAGRDQKRVRIVYKNTQNRHPTNSILNSFFINREFSGTKYGSIEDIQIEENKRYAIIKFGDARDADSVVQRRLFTLNEFEMTATAYHEQDNDNNTGMSQMLTKVKVEYLRGWCDHKMLESIFSQESINGVVNGHVEKVVEVDGETIVELGNIEEAEMLARRGSYTIGQTELKVSLYREPLNFNQADLFQGMLDVDDYRPSQERRIVIIGKTGSGKSATANNLVGKEAFRSKMGASSVSNQCSKIEGERQGYKLVVVDTPGLCDTYKSQEETTTEIMKCIGISSPGPHAVVLVIQVGRITKEETDTVDRFIQYFGEPVFRYMLIVFTRIDDLDGPLDEFIRYAPKSLQKVIQRCENRYIGFNNKGTNRNKAEQLAQFFATVENIVKQNNGSCYTNYIYKEVEAALQIRIKERKAMIEMEKEAKIRKIQEEYKRKETKIMDKKMKAQHDADRYETLQQIQRQYKDQMDMGRLRDYERNEIEKNKPSFLANLTRLFKGKF